MGQEDELDRLLTAVRPQLEATTERAVERMIAEAASYRALSPEELQPVVRGNLLASLENVAGDAGELFREAGRVRARQGVSVDDMLHGWRIGLEELRRTARACAAELGMSDSIVLAFTERSLAWADRGMLESTAEHRRAELEIVRREQHVRANLVREILLGALAAGDLRAHVLAYGLDLGAVYTPFRVQVTTSLDVRGVERAFGVADTAGPRWGLAALIDGDLAGFTSRLPAELSGGAVAGLGPSAALDGLAHPFTLASRALDAAIHLGRSGLVDFAGLDVLAAVFADDDVSRPLYQSIMRPLLDAGTSGATILATVRRYIDNDRRLDQTARELHAHVNTIRNRLERFEQLTGRDLRRTADLVAVWWALQRTPGERARAIDVQAGDITRPHGRVGPPPAAGRGQAASAL